MIRYNFAARILSAILVIVTIFSFIPSITVKASPATNRMQSTSQTEIEVIIPSQSFLEGTPGTFTINLDIQQYESIGSYRVEIPGTDIPPQFAHPEVISPVDLPAHKIGKFTFVLPPHTVGTFFYPVRVTYRPNPDNQVDFYNTDSNDIIINYGNVGITWNPQTPPLILDASNLPAVIRGYLTTDGYTNREVVYANNSGELSDVGGNDIILSVPNGPYKVGEEYAVSIKITSSDNGAWTKNNSSGVPKEILGLERSSIDVFYDQNKETILNPIVNYRGQTAADEIVTGTIDILTAGINIEGTLLKTAVKEFLKTAAFTLGKILINTADDAWFTPTETADFVNHSAHPSLPTQNPAKLELILGDPSKGMLDVAEIYELTLTYKLKFLSAGTHEIVLTPNLTSNVLVTSTGNLITSTFLTNFEYRDDIILRFDVQNPNTPPTLSNPQLSPSNSGDTTTNFVFSVQYRDMENDTPDSVSAIVDGNTVLPLTSTDQTYSDGSIFTSIARTFSTGVHSYYYRTIQGTNTVTTSPLNFYVNQTSNGHNLTLTTLSLDKTSAKQGSIVTTTGQINNTGTYTENNINVETHVTGPGSYSQTYTKNIGSLNPGGIWGMGTIATWSIPANAQNGEYFIQVTANPQNGDENWSDNVQTRSVYVSNTGPLVHMAYQYQFKQLNWSWTPALPAPFNTWGAYGPGQVTNPNNGKTYQVWVTDTGSNEWSFYVKDSGGTIYRDFYEDAIPSREVDYEDGFNLLFSSPSVTVNENYVWIKMGYPQPSASISPTTQTAPLGSQVSYSISVPCGGSCNYTNNYVYTASGGDDPPYEFFHTAWPASYSVSGSGPSFTLNIAPSTTGVKSIAFDTRKQDLTSQNYITYTKIEGYQPVDNPPNVQIDHPIQGLVVYGAVSFSATASDDKGVTNVEFYVDGTLKVSDTTSPYSYSWDTTTVTDGSHTLMIVAHDTAGQTKSQSVVVTVDNNPPAISNVSHTPASPTNLTPVLVQATLADASGISTAILKYSRNAGNSWTNLAMTNSSGNTWQAMIPVGDIGDVLYKIEATDSLARLTTSSQYSYHVSDASAPVFYNWLQTPSNVTEDTLGAIRITVSIMDVGGSGVSSTPPGFDYRIGETGYDGYESMVSAGQNAWYFDIPPRDWNTPRGQTLYYKVQASDLAGNSATSSEHSDLIDSINDSPQITSSSPSSVGISLNPGMCQDFQITTTDADNDTLSYSWKLDNNPVASGQTYTYCSSAQDNGTHLVVAAASDGNLQAIRSWQVTIGNSPEVDVKGKGTSIANGDTTPSTSDDTEFDSANVTGGVVAHIFTIYNTGNADLVLSGTQKVSVTGVNASDFTVTVQPTSPIAGPSGSATFTVTFDPSAIGLRTATISIVNNDLNESPYTFSVQGTGTGSICGDLLFADNFSTSKGWIDQSNGYIVQDQTNQWLNWTAARSHPMRYYIPVNASSECAQLKFRFNVTSASGNGGVYFGLVENLDAPANIWGVDATGIFVGPHRDTAYGHKVALASLYSNGGFDGVDNQVSTINYGGFNLWRKAILTVNHGNWSLIVTTDGGDPIGQMNGTLSGQHTAYNYLMMLFEVSSGWETETGYLDDVEFYGAPTAPGAATITSPTGAIGANYNPTYTWKAVNGATWYLLQVDGPSGNVIKQWYSTAQANCNETTCSVTPSTTLSAGAYKWWIQTWNSVGYGPWSTRMDFSVAVPTLPGKATLTSPTSSITTTAPTYTWSVVSGATYYYLYVNGPSGNVIKQWYEASVICSGGTCSVAPSTALASGTHKWWVQTWNSAGYGPWSDEMTFTVPAPTLPGKAILTKPTGNAFTTTPTYTWDEASDTTWYYLYVDGPSGNVIKQWYDAAAICSEGTCSVTPSTALSVGAHKWWIQTWGPTGYGPWSDTMDFTVAVPGKASLTAPAGSISDPTPDYTWSAVEGATWYYLYVNGPSGAVIKQWYDAAAVCSGGTCSVTPTTALGSGAHSWWIQAWGPTGYGPWSDRMDFTLP